MYSTVQPREDARCTTAQHRNHRPFTQQSALQPYPASWPAAATHLAAQPTNRWRTCKNAGSKSSRPEINKCCTVHMQLRCATTATQKPQACEGQLNYRTAPAAACWAALK